MKTYADEIDSGSIGKKWPAGRKPPPLIFDVAKFVATQPLDSLGDAYFRGDRMDDFWIEDGADLWPYFGIFLKTSTGSRVAQWFREDSMTPSVVYLGSEGELSILSSTMEGFFAAWSSVDDRSSDRNDTRLPFEFSPGDGIDGRPAFSAYLRQRSGMDSAEFLSSPLDNSPLVAFMDGWSAAARARHASDPALQEIVQILDRYVPRGKKVWQTTNMLVLIAGDRCEISCPRPYHEGSKLPEEDAVAPLLHRVREARAAGIHALRGLWHRATVRLSSDGSCKICCDWEGEPAFRDGSKPSRADVRKDLERFPRSKSWMEPWLVRAAA